MKKLNLLIRLLLLLIGIIILGFGAAFLTSVGIGGDAVLVFEQGFAKAINVNLGNGVLILNIIILIILFFLDRQMINIGTVITVLLIGPIINFFLKVNLFPNSSYLIIKILLCLIAILITAFGIALYLYANIGYAPFEGIIMAVKKKTKLEFRYIKIANDVILFIVGWVLGGTFGIGSIMTIFLFGPLIDFYTKLIKKIKLV